MHRTPEGQTDAAIRPRLSRWARVGAAWLARLRPVVRRARVRRLLFLDDDPRRAEVFLGDHPDAVWVTTVPDCLARLAEPWDEVHLDHDLGGKMFVDSQDADCGMEVIRWLCKEPRAHLRESLFFVHTHNATAGLLMVLLMQRGGYKAEFRPFGLDLRKLLAHNEPRAAAQRASAPDDPSRRRGRWVSVWRNCVARVRGAARIGERK